MSVVDLHGPYADCGPRFVPTREIDERQRAFNLLDEDERLLNMSHRIIPHESDAARGSSACFRNAADNNENENTEQANATFSTMLSKELADEDTMSVSRPSSPIRSSSSTSGAASSANQSTPMPRTPTRKRVFSFHTPPRNGASTPVMVGQDTPLASAYASSPVKPTTSNFITSPQRSLRTVCKTPFRVLDAPDLTDDFYLNLVDWSSTNVLGVGLGSCVYLWSAKTAQVTKLCDLGTSDSITSLSWVQKGSTLAVGTYNGAIQIWDAVKETKLRSYDAHQHRIGALAWDHATVTSGSRDRTIQHRDVRVGGKAYQTLLGHRQEVCGLKWNSGQKQLASGGNDNKLLIWDHRGGHPDTPLWKWHEHSAAVKAIAWNPHQPGVLVSGGGTLDKKMRFWNTLAGTLLTEVDTGSQVRFHSLWFPFQIVADGWLLGIGVQSNLVQDVTRTRFYPRLLVGFRPEPDLYLEVSVDGHGGHPLRAYASCSLSRNVTGWTDNRHWCRRRDAEVLECIPAEERGCKWG